MPERYLRVFLLNAFRIFKYPGIIISTRLRSDKMKILDLSCGLNKLKSEGNEVIGIDFDKAVNPDVVWNLNEFHYPFKDNEFDEIVANHSIEHLDYSAKDPMTY